MIGCYNVPVDRSRFAAATRRIPPLLILALGLSACTGLLLGGGSNSGRPLGSDTRSASQVTADSAISAEVRSRFAGDPAVARQALQVSTVNRRVTLYGTVDSYPARDRAVQLARGVEGIGSVDNRIKVETRPDRY